MEQTNDNPFPLARWTGTTAVLADGTIGLMFDAQDGQDICFALSLKDANDLVESIAGFVTDHEFSTLRQSTKSGGSPSEDVGVPPQGLQRPLDAEKAAISGVLKAPSA